MNTDDQLPNPTIVADESTVMPRSMRVTAGLYVVATPIGNMADISERARHTLAAVDIVAAEDTRRTGRMLTQLGIRAELISCHEHNEMQRAEQFVAEVRKGRSVALVSDAGTPLMSDPGYRLVKAMRDAGLPVTPVPGSCAAIAALSVAGLPSDRFRFEGFLPAAQKARQSRLQALASATETLIFYAGVHKVETVLADCRAAFGADRAAVARVLDIRAGDDPALWIVRHDQRGTHMKAGVGRVGGGGDGAGGVPQHGNLPRIDAHPLLGDGPTRHGQPPERGSGRGGRPLHRRQNEVHTRHHQSFP